MNEVIHNDDFVDYTCMKKPKKNIKFFTLNGIKTKICNFKEINSRTMHKCFSINYKFHKGNELNFV